MSQKIQADQAYPNPNQPRKRFPEQYIRELAISFITSGQRQAATVVTALKWPCGHILTVNTDEERILWNTLNTFQNHHSPLPPILLVSSTAKAVSDSAAIALTSPSPNQKRMMESASSADSRLNGDSDASAHFSSNRSLTSGAPSNGAGTSMLPWNFVTSSPVACRSCGLSTPMLNEASRVSPNGLPLVVATAGRQGKTITSAVTGAIKTRTSQTPSADRLNQSATGGNSSASENAPDAVVLIVAGECRWHGVNLANRILAAWRADNAVFQSGAEGIPAAPAGMDWSKLPKAIPYKVEVDELTDEEIAEIALIENVTRRDLSPVEEAMAYRDLLATRTEEDVASKTGKTAYHIRRRIRLLSLDPEVLEYVDNGQLSPSHAEALCRLANPKDQLPVLRRWIKEGLTLDQVNALVEARNAKAQDSSTISLFDQAAYKPTAAQRRAQKKLDELLDACGKLLKGATDPKTLQLIPTLRGLTGRDLEKVRLVIQGLRQVEKALAVQQEIKRTRRKRAAVS